MAKVRTFNSWVKNPKAIQSTASVQDILEQKKSQGAFAAICNGGCASCGASGCDSGGSSGCSGCGVCGA